MAYFDKRAARLLKKTDAKTGKYSSYFTVILSYQILFTLIRL